VFLAIFATLGKHVVTGATRCCGFAPNLPPAGCRLNDVEAYVEGDGRLFEPDGGQHSDKSHVRHAALSRPADGQRDHVRPAVEGFPLYAKAGTARRNARESAVAAASAPSAPPTLIVSTQPAPTGH